MSRIPAGGGRIAARFVALDATHHLAPGEVVWDRRGRIVALRRARGSVDDVCVLPGLVNAHAHLQLGALVGNAPPPDFLAWIGAVLAARAAATPAAERRTTRAAIADLLATGTTALGDIDTSGHAAAVLAQGPLRARAYRELTGFHLGPAAAGRLVATRHAVREGGGAVASGLSPHAPYSVSPALFRAAARCCRHLAIHCAEVPEEQQFLHTGRGPFRDLLERLQRLPAGFRPPGLGAVRWLHHLGVLRATTQLVHCQELERGDVDVLAASGATIAVCPGTVEYFGRTPPPVPRWLRAGIPVALGTDSRASNTCLSMLHELRRAAVAWPSLAPATLLAMATAHGGRSLGLPGAGVLRRGGRADFLVTAAGAAWAPTLRAFVHGELPVQAVVCEGRTVAGRGGPRGRPGR